MTACNPSLPDRVGEFKRIDSEEKHRRHIIPDVPRKSSQAELTGGWSGRP